MSSNIHNPRGFIQALAAISATSSGQGISNKIFRLIGLEACSATFLTHGSLNWSIPLDWCPRSVFADSPGSESVTAAECFCWEGRALEWKVTGIKAFSLESLLCLELTGPDPCVDRGSSTDGYEEEEADEGLVGAVDKVCFGDLRAAVDKRPVANFDYGWFGVGVSESGRCSSSIS